MSAMKGVLLLMAFASLASAQTGPTAFAVPPPVEQLTADCARPVYASDQLVCGDAELRLQDDRLALLLNGRPELAQRNGSAFFEAQSAWFKRRSMCAMNAEHRKCLSAAYAERMRVVEVVGTTVSANSRQKRCKLAKPFEAVVLASTHANEILMAFSGNEVVGLAIQQGNDDQWRPFLRYSKVNSSIVLSGISNSIGKCRAPG